MTMLYTHAANMGDVIKSQLDG